MQSLLTKTQKAEAVAEIFWRAFSALDDLEQRAVLARLERMKPPTQTIVKPVRVLRELAGLVAWGGDALEDTERYYDDL